MTWRNGGVAINDRDLYLLDTCARPDEPDDRFFFPCIAAAAALQGARHGKRVQPHAARCIANDCAAGGAYREPTEKSTEQPRSRIVARQGTTITEDQRLFGALCGKCIEKRCNSRAVVLTIGVNGEGVCCAPIGGGCKSSEQRGRLALIVRKSDHLAGRAVGNQPLFSDIRTAVCTAVVHYQGIQAVCVQAGEHLRNRCCVVIEGNDSHNG